MSTFKIKRKELRFHEAFAEKKVGKEDWVGGWFRVPPEY